METDKHVSVVSEHDTNQNEATLGRQSKSFDHVLNKPISMDLTLSDHPSTPVTKPEQVVICPGPSIIVTPPSPTSDDSPEQRSFSARDMHADGNQSFPSSNSRYQSVNNTSCPEIGSIPYNTDQYCKESTQATLEKPQIDFIEQSDNVVCSSTPKRDSPGSSENQTGDGSCGIMSLDAPSPIIKESDPSFISNENSNPRRVSTTHTNNPCIGPTISCSDQSNMCMSPQGLNIHQSGHVDTPRPAFDVNIINSPESQSDWEPRQHGSDSSIVEQDQGIYNQTKGPQQGSSFQEYYPQSEGSWTNVNYRPEVYMPPPSISESCYQPRENEHFVYPSIYVSSAGLISVLLRNDMSVEMTVDRTIRVVSHNHMMAVATDSRGTAATLYHPAAKVFQAGTTTDIATDNFRARLGGGECILFSNGVNYFKLEDSDLQPIAPVKFSDISRDQSVNLLFSSEGYGEPLVASCMQVASQAEYSNLPRGGVIIRINGVKVTQTGGGDVSVVTGAKFIRLSPHLGTARLGNRFVDIEIEKDWTVKLTKGSHSFMTSKKCSMVCNGKMEAGFDENSSLKAANLVPMHPFLADAGLMRRFPPRKPARFIGPADPIAKRRHFPSVVPRGRGGRMF